MPFCDECGLPCQVMPVTSGESGHGISTTHPVAPVCSEHGPRWRLIRNAPCSAVLVVRDDSVLLARRAREPWIGQWEVPGGFVEQGEHPAEAAARELREELGIRVRLTGLLGVYVHPGSAGEYLQILVYVGETVDEPVADPSEVLEWRWFAGADIPQVMAADHRRRIDDWLAGRAVPLPGGHTAVDG